MAFNFFGTFTTGQFEAFENFTKLQQLDLLLRKAWLDRQIQRVGKFSTTYDDAGIPIEFAITPRNSYAAKLLEAYKILGGTPEFDMLLRTRDKPVYLTSGPSLSITEDQLVTGGYSSLYSNGRRNRGDQRFDRNLGLKVEKLKKWQLGAIKQKRERLEFKIKRALDYVDQLEQELVLINRLLGSGLGSVDDQILDVKREMRNPGAANVVVSNDIYGHDIGEVADNLLPDAEGEAVREKQRGGPQTGYDQVAAAFNRHEKA
jgi:hypothetical protein